MRKFWALAVICGVALALILAPGVRANTITVGLQQAGVNGGAITTVFSGNGAVSYSGSYGTFVLNQLQAQGSPYLPQPQLSSSSLNTASSAGGILKVYVTQQGLTSTLNPFISGFTLNNPLNFVNSVKLETFINTTNGLFGGAFLASRTFSTIGSDSSTDFFAGLTGPFSETEVYTIDLGAGGSSNASITLTAVPEPTSMLLFGSGFSGLAMLLRRRNKKAAEAQAA